ncbi:flagellar motor switch protein FliG [Aureliella helgolandensis]|uniref:Flagellar motor switch protein FliG n=1 Tax=Aureliella helgolandensis TaxID=2527968 RepID=A0A518GGI0_9BACT|nr:flagellar motor switch protein FliG [Aureliella helgolandensis]QDV27677.1 Flagellar motor switch protein FliG [Aureliella helgolandensis]
MSTQVTYSISPGVRRAAILIMSLAEEDAAKILGLMPRRYVETVALAIAQLETISSREQEDAISEFLRSRPSAIGPNSGGLDKAKNLVKKALGNEASDTLSVLQQTLEALPFGFLHKADPQNILSFLIDEHPQTIAMVLSNIPPAVAAGVLSGLPALKQLEVIQRIAEMGQTSPDAIEEVEKALSTRMSLFMTQSYRKGGGVPAVAEMLNVSERSTERTILDGLTKERPELVDEIRRLMFVFEDLLKINDKDIQNVLKNVETSQWALALKGASQPLQEKVLGNMSSRAADMLREEMEFLGKVRLSEVEGMQQKIVDVVRTLEDSGQLSRPSGDQEEEFVT